MKISTFRERLISDPDYAFSYIVANNFEAVADRLRALDYTIGNEGDVFDALNDLKEKQDWRNLTWAFSVPMLTDSVDSGQLAVVADVAAGLAQSGRAKNQPNPDVFDPTGGAGFTEGSGNGGQSYGPEPPPSGSGSGSGALNWFNAIVSGFTQTWAAMNQGTKPVQNVSTSADAALAAQQEAQRKRKRNRNILIAVGAVVLIVIGFVAWKALKK